MFLLQDGALGALEHPDSLTLGVPSATLAGNPYAFHEQIAHEFVHAWNLMRIHPEESHGMDYRAAKRSAGLWFSEGLSMFYADLLLRRAGLPESTPSRIAHLEELIARYLAEPGNARFSAEQVSRAANDARPGALGDYSASTHLQGELLGAMLDLVIRDATANRRSMDDVMRAMLDRFSGTHGFTGKDIENTVTGLCGCEVASLFNAYVHGAAEFREALMRLRVGDRIAIEVKHSGVVRTATVTITPLDRPKVRISELTHVTERQRAVLDHWR